MTYRKYLSLALLVAGGVVLVGLQYPALGLPLLLACTLSLLWTNTAFAGDMLLVIASLVVLGSSAIDTRITTDHILSFGSVLLAVVFGPYLLSKYLYKKNNIQFYFGSFNKDLWLRLGYIGLTAIIAYLLLPFYLRETGAYMHWPSETDTGNLIRLFIGTNGLGIWDELFFVVVVFNLFKSHFHLWWANIAQAVLWTAFLYELGFISWGVIAIFVFALTQGYIFHKTHSLPYTIAIHLTLDFILFLALVNAHNPSYFPIFMT